MPCWPKFASSEEEEAFKRDSRLALDFLYGGVQKDKRGIRRRVFLSASTKPTEKEGRMALRRVLERLQGATGYVVLGAIADAFDPTHLSERRAVFRRLTQGHNDPVRDGHIGWTVDSQLIDWDRAAREDFPLRDITRVRNKTTKAQAYETVADQTGLSVEQVRRVYANYRKPRKKSK